MRTGRVFSRLEWIHSGVCGARRRLLGAEELLLCWLGLELIVSACWEGPSDVESVFCAGAGVGGFTVLEETDKDHCQHSRIDVRELSV